LTLWTEHVRQRNSTVLGGEGQDLGVNAIRLSSMLAYPANPPALVE
jgi:hypothetical protein